MEIIPCIQATYLISKLEEHALTLCERLQLLVHLIVCEFCRRFLKQTKIISKEVNKLVREERVTEKEHREIEEALHLT